MISIRPSSFFLGLAGGGGGKGGWGRRTTTLGLEKVRFVRQEGGGGGGVGKADHHLRLRESKVCTAGNVFNSS